MRGFILQEDTTEGQTLDTFETGYVGRDAAVITSEVASVTTNGYVELSVFGTLHAINEPSVLHTGASLDLTIARDGIVSASADVFAISAVPSIGAYIVNDGQIYAEYGAVGVYCEGLGAEINISNSGIIHSNSSAAIKIDGGTKASLVYNTGELRGKYGVEAVGATNFINHGEMLGTLYGYISRENATADEIYNYGIITGGVYTGDGEDKVTNRDYIDYIDMGLGDDKYVSGRNGYIETSVKGGEGDDVIIGGDDDDRFYGQADDDQLKGRKGDDVLKGAAGNDYIAGNRGDDTLSGGGDDDEFVFAAKGGSDVIEDFGDNDVINLTRLGLTNYATDIVVNMRDTSSGTFIDLEEDHGLTILLEGVLSATVVATDFVL